MATATVQVSIRLPEAKWDRLYEIAHRRGYTAPALVRDIIDDYLERHYAPTPTEGEA